MSVRHFTRVFTAEVGETPGKFVERVRVEAARVELETTNDTLDLIAARCGFGTAESLRRVTQRRLGVAPDAYRRRLRRHEERLPKKGHPHDRPATASPSPVCRVHRPRRRGAVRGPPAHPLHRRHFHRTPAWRVPQRERHARPDGGRHLCRDTRTRRDRVPRRGRHPADYRTTKRSSRGSVTRTPRPGSPRRCAPARWCSARPGFSHGLTATTHWACYPELAVHGALPTAQRVVEHLDHRIITAAGVSSGIDMALRLVELLVDRTGAEAAQLMIEYDPQPPFDAGAVAKSTRRHAAGWRSTPRSATR